MRCFGRLKDWWNIAINHCKKWKEIWNSSKILKHENAVSYMQNDSMCAMCMQLTWNRAFYNCILIFNLHEIWHQNILYRTENESNLVLRKFVDAVCLHYHKLFIVKVFLFSLPHFPKHSRLHYILFPTFSYVCMSVRVHKVHMCLCCSLFRWSIDIFRWFFIQCHVFFVTES